MEHSRRIEPNSARSAASACCLFVVSCLLQGCGGCADEQPPTGPPPVKPPVNSETENGTQPKNGYTALTNPQRERAGALYTQHCESCHAKKGDGNGIAAQYLFPKPRNFRAGKYRLVSTVNGVPTAADLQKVLERGMPGSSMPAWPKLSEEDRHLLAERVMEFRREGIRESERKLAAEFGEELPAEKLNRIVEDLTTPGAVIGVPPLAPFTPESVARGKELYLDKGCAKCHGTEGKGDGQEVMVNAEGLPNPARDLTQGIFKGSPDPESVYRRTQAGMPGSAMPSSQQLTHEQITDMVRFVLSLSDEETRAAAVLNRERIVAKALATAAQSPDDVAWNDIPPIRVRTTPLWWRNEFPRWIEVRAVHDGKTIAVHLSWPDAEADSQAAKSEAFEDAVAMQLYRGDAEPFIGMGAAAANLDVWMWDADRQSGGPDVEDVNPTLVVDRYPFSEKAVDTAEYKRPGTLASAQPDISLPARASGNQIVPSPRSPVPAATSLETAGPQTVTFRPPISQSVQAQGTWRDGRWSVVMTRALTTNAGDGGVSLAPGEPASVAFAVWNGSNRDRDGKKSITIWQELVLEEPPR